MRTLRVHNQYQIRGGEEVVFDAEVSLLRLHGHDVGTLQLDNDALATGSSVEKLRLAASTVWSREGRRLVAEAIERYKPDVIHFDNTLPRLSPAAYSVGRDAGVAVVQTLHNYRPMCPNGMFLRDGGPCEDCMGKLVPLPGVVHGCYRGSRAQSAVVAAMITTHRLRGTYSKDVDRYIALTEFARGKFVEGGLPADRIQVKPNFIPNRPLEQRERGGHFLFVGRLAREKGINDLLAAQALHNQTLRIAGDGPFANDLTQAALQHSALQPLGRLDRDVVQDEMRSARALVFPSAWYEGFPMTLVEAFASGLPVIASRLGSMLDIVEEGKTGLFFEQGNPEDLATKIRWAAEHPEEMRRMGENARREYETKYTPERNYDMLMDIYEQAIHQARNPR